MLNQIIRTKELVNVSKSNGVLEMLEHLEISNNSQFGVYNVTSTFWRWKIQIEKEWNWRYHISFCI